MSSCKVIAVLLTSKSNIVAVPSSIVTLPPSADNSISPVASILNNAGAIMREA